MKIRDHSELFKQKDYQDQFERKKEFDVGLIRRNKKCLSLAETQSTQRKAKD
jgi:hypothetical protein